MSNRLSVVIITKNEEVKIGRCIESVNWADEIIIVDDESADRTREIVRNLGARVIVNVSGGNFDRQRNIGVDEAKNEWILQMDADEIVTDELKKKIVEVLNRPGDFSGFKFRRKNYFVGHFMRYADQYHYWLRLFRKDKGRYIGNDVHEKIEVKGRIGLIEAQIEHFAFSSITQFIQRQNCYSSFESKALFKREGILSKKKIKYNLTIKPLKIFWKNYLKKKGYKDGIYGLVWCLLLAVRQIMIWSKYWELVQDATKERRKV